MFPFSRGCSFYTLNQQGQIAKARDLVEGSVKPGASALKVRYGTCTARVRHDADAAGRFADCLYRSPAVVPFALAACSGCVWSTSQPTGTHPAVPLPSSALHPSPVTAPVPRR